MQYATTDTSKPLTAKQTKHTEQAVGLILYYARGVDSTLAATLSTIASGQSAGTDETLGVKYPFGDYP
eukprot:7995000-Ditylum_brightwellii.AAC.1